MVIIRQLNWRYFVATMQGAELFDTVPNDYLKLKDKYNRIAQFLDFDQTDVAQATGVPLASVRYDKRINSALRERLREWAVLFNLVACHFKGDPSKTAAWFMTPNPLLGNVPPRDMIRFGESRKLHKYVFNALAQNKR